MEHQQKRTDIQTFSLKTSDRQTIAVTQYKRGHSGVVILAHGFFNNKDVYLLKKLAEDLCEHYDVISFDFRGHGKSDGLFGWTSHEQQDIGEVLKYAQGQGYERIGVIGFSLGAAIALIAASQDRNIHSVIAVSPPFDFWQIDYHFWEPEMFEDLKLNLGYKGIGKGVRPGNPFEAKVRPLDIVSKVAPTPILFIHGGSDWLIKPQHSEKLFKAALEPKQYLHIPGAGHAEKIYDTHSREFLQACLEWFKTTFLKEKGDVQ